jgi:hypothetical protein
MKPRHITPAPRGQYFSMLVLVFALGAAALFAQPKPAGQNPSPAKPEEKDDYFVKVVLQANKLLAPHVKVAPLPVPLPNPFREPGYVEPEAVPAAGGETAPALSGSALLTKLTSELRITGMVNSGGRRSLIVNGSPRREGDVLTVKSATATHYLVLKSLGNGTATFALDGAESTVRFRMN